MSSPGSGARAGILRLALLAIACAIPGGAAPARAAAAARDGGAEALLVEATRLAGEQRFGAAESLLLRLPAPPADTAAALDRDQARRERAWLHVRGHAPGACDSTWRWRPARLVAALERRRERPAALAGVWADRSRVEYRQGLWREAIASARTALALLDRARAREPLTRYRAHLALAEALVTQDQVRAAPELALADSLARALGGAAAADRPRHLRVAGSVAIMNGDFATAAKRMAECVAAADARTPPDDAEAGLGLLFLGYAEGFTDAAKGEAHRTRARERLEGALGLGDERTLLAIGRSVASVRDPALLPVLGALADRAREHLRAHGLADAACAWDVDYARSRVYLQLGRYDASDELLGHAIAVSRRWHGPDNLREYLATVDLGIACWLRRDTTASLRHHRRALEINAKHPVSLVNDANFPRNYIASAFASGGRLAAARDEYAAQWEDYRTLYGETNRLASIPAARAARSSRGLGDTAAAETWFQRALLPFSAAAGGTREEYSEVRASYALYLYWRGDHRRAFEIALENARLRRAVVDETVPWIAETDAVRFANNRRQDHEVLMSLALWTPDAPADLRAAAWTEMAMGRGLVLEALLRRVKAAGDTADDGAGALRRELAERVLASLRSYDAGSSRRALDSLRAEIARRELGPGGPGAPATRRPGIDPGEASRRLGGGALVSYLRTQLYEREGAVGDVVWWPREYYLAFVLAAGDMAPRVLLLGRADSLDAAVSEWRAAALARSPGPAAFAAGERLRRLAWDPVAALLPALGPVWLVPDGELQKVNFYALPVAPGRFLVEEPLVLHRLSSERDLVAPPGAEADARGLLVLGDVDYGGAAPAAAEGGAGPAATGAPPAASRAAPPACRALLEARFEPLPATRGEAAAIAALARTLPSASDAAPLSLTGPEADEASFKRLAPGRRVVHLATHSFFLGAECAGAGRAANVVAQNPLVFSGIALADANRWHDAHERHEAEDGLLTAEELAGLDLRGTEWLVLSGCESGLGQVKSWEGVFGLPRAGRRAGVRSLVMSLAPVDDDASSLWMRALYEARFTRGEGTARAVRSASRRVLEWLRSRGRPAEPRLWGAFVALGE